MFFDVTDTALLALLFLFLKPYVYSFFLVYPFHSSALQYRSVSACFLVSVTRLNIFYCDFLSCFTLLFLFPQNCLLEKRVGRKQSENEVWACFCIIFCLSFISSVSYFLVPCFVFFCLYSCCRQSRRKEFCNFCGRRYISIIQIFWWCRTGWISRNK